MPICNCTCKQAAMTATPKYHAHTSLDDIVEQTGMNMRFSDIGLSELTSAFPPARMQTSCPDTVVSDYSESAASSRMCMQPYLTYYGRRDPPCTKAAVHLLELGLTSDLFLHAAMTSWHQEARSQQSNMLSFKAICKPLAGSMSSSIR